MWRRSCRSTETMNGTTHRTGRVQRTRRQYIAARGALRILISVALAPVASAAAPTDIEIDHPWCASASKGVTTGACYVTVRNLGTMADRIVGVDMDVAGHVELHETSIANGVMKMRPLPHGIEIPAGTLLDLHGLGYHIMLIDLKSVLEPGRTIEGSLQFERAGSRPIKFRVETSRPRGHSHRQ